MGNTASARTRICDAQPAIARSCSGSGSPQDDRLLHRLAASAARAEAVPRERIYDAWRLFNYGNLLRLCVRLFANCSGGGSRKGMCVLRQGEEYRCDASSYMACRNTFDPESVRLVVRRPSEMRAAEMRPGTARAPFLMFRTAEAEDGSSSSTSAPPRYRAHVSVYPVRLDAPTATDNLHFAFDHPASRATMAAVNSGSEHLGGLLSMRQRVRPGEDALELDPDFLFELEAIVFPAVLPSGPEGQRAAARIMAMLDAFVRIMNLAHRTLPGHGIGGVDEPDFVEPMLAGVEMKMPSYQGADEPPAAAGSFLWDSEAAAAGSLPDSPGLSPGAAPLPPGAAPSLPEGRRTLYDHPKPLATRGSSFDLVPSGARAVRAARGAARSAREGARSAGSAGSAGAAREGARSAFAAASSSSSSSSPGPGNPADDLAPLSDEQLALAEAQREAELQRQLDLERERAERERAEAEQVSLRRQSETRAAEEARLAAEREAAEAAERARHMTEQEVAEQRERQRRETEQTRRAREEAQRLRQQAREAAARAEQLQKAADVTDAALRALDEGDPERRDDMEWLAEQILTPTFGETRELLGALLRLVDGDEDMMPPLTYAIPPPGKERAEMLLETFDIICDMMPNSRYETPSQRTMFLPGYVNQKTSGDALIWLLGPSLVTSSEPDAIELGRAVEPLAAIGRLPRLAVTRDPITFGNAAFALHRFVIDGSDETTERLLDWFGVEFKRPADAVFALMRQLVALTNALFASVDSFARPTLMRDLTAMLNTDLHPLNIRAIEAGLAVEVPTPLLLRTYAWLIEDLTEEQPEMKNYLADVNLPDELISASLRGRSGSVHPNNSFTWGQEHKAEEDVMAMPAADFSLTTEGAAAAAKQGHTVADLVVSIFAPDDLDGGPKPMPHRIRLAESVWREANIGKNISHNAAMLWKQLFTLSLILHKKMLLVEFVAGAETITEDRKRIVQQTKQQAADEAARQLLLELEADDAAGAAGAGAGSGSGSGIGKRGGGGGKGKGKKGGGKKGRR